MYVHKLLYDICCDVRPAEAAMWADEMPSSSEGDTPLVPSFEISSLAASLLFLTIAKFSAVKPNGTGS